MGQDSEVADLAAKYVYIVYPFHFFYLLEVVFSDAYAVSCRVTHYMLICILSGTIAHALMVYVFCFVNDWGFSGICWASGLMWFVRGMVAITSVKCGGKLPTFDDVFLFSSETVSNVLPIVKLALKNCAMGVWGWWAFDLFTLMASYLGTDVVGAQTIMRSIGLLAFMMPIGFSTGAGIFINNVLGEGKPRVAM